jgi:hypothetical protein
MAPDDNGEDADKPQADAPKDGPADDMIARNLKRMFENAETEALPPRLQELLQQLQDEERGGS